MDQSLTKKLDIEESSKHRISKAFFSNSNSCEENLIVEWHKDKKIID